MNNAFIHVQADGGLVMPVPVPPFACWYTKVEGTKGGRTIVQFIFVLRGPDDNGVGDSMDRIKASPELAGLTWTALNSQGMFGTANLPAHEVEIVEYEKISSSQYKLITEATADALRGSTTANPGVVGRTLTLEALASKWETETYQKRDKR